VRTPAKPAATSGECASWFCDGLCRDPGRVAFILRPGQHQVGPAVVVVVPHARSRHTIPARSHWRERSCHRLVDVEAGQRCARDERDPEGRRGCNPPTHQPVVEPGMGRRPNRRTGRRRRAVDPRGRVARQLPAVTRSKSPSGSKSPNRVSRTSAGQVGGSLVKPSGRRSDRMNVLAPNPSETAPPGRGRRSPSLSWSPSGGCGSQAGQAGRPAQKWPFPRCDTGAWHSSASSKSRSAVLVGIGPRHRPLRTPGKAKSPNKNGV